MHNPHNHFIKELLRLCRIIPRAVEIKMKVHFYLSLSRNYNTNQEYAKRATCGKVIKPRNPILT